MATSQNTIFKKFSQAITIITFIVSLLIAAVSITVWASNEHAALRSETIEQVDKMKLVIDTKTEKYYVPLHEFRALQQDMKNHKESHIRMERQLDRIERMLNNNN